MTIQVAERNLIELAKTGDTPALECLLVTHSEELRRHIARRFPPSLRATIAVDDVLQHTFIEAFSKIDRLRETSSAAFSVWLRSIAAMSLLSFLKAHHRKKREGAAHRIVHTTDSQTGSLVDLVDKLPGADPTASNVLSRQEAMLAIQVAVAALPDEQRQAIQMHLLEGKTVDQTAVAMDRTPGAVRGLLQRGKKSLAESMGRASAWLTTT